MKKVTALILTILIMISIVPTSVYASEMSMCPHCYGSGTTYGTGYETCDECHGRGYTGDYYQMVMCEKCNGTGEMRKRITCEFCKGTGDVLVYTVYYDPNWGINAPSKQIKYAGEPLYLSKQLPIWDWGDDIRVFAGWSTTALGEAEYQPGDKYDIDADITLYAVWKKASVITYDANGGTGAPPSQAVEQGKTVYLSRNTPTRSGYKFSGWSTTASGDTIYNPGDPYTLNSDITLYAVWLPYNNGYTYTVENGKATITDCDKNLSKTVVLPDTLGGYPVVGIGEYAFENCNKIWTVHIPESVTYIGANAFEGCSQLMTVVLPKEGLISIGDGAFRECSWLNEITIPKSVTNIGEGVFYKTSSDLSIGCYENSAGYTYVRKNNLNYHITPELYIRQSSIELNRGESSQVTVTATGDAVKYLDSVIWTLSDPTIVNVSDSGRSTKDVVGLSAGQTTITAKIEMDSYPFVMEASCTIIVKESYIINYISDGTVSDMPTKQIKQPGESLVIREKIPRRKQYHFEGWSIQPNDTKVEYLPGDKYTDDADVTLYAVWTWKPECSSCSGTGSINRTCTACSGQGEVVTTGSPCRSCDGKGSWQETYTVKEERTCAICHGELVIWSDTAQSWIPCRFCEGDGIVIIDVEKQKTVNCLDCLGTGKTLIKISCKACSGKGYKPTLCTSCNGDGKVDREIYYINYVNDGIGGPTVQEKQQGIPITLSKDIPVLPGYIFRGWETTIGDTKIIYQPGDNYTADENSILTAIWEAQVSIPGNSCGDVNKNGTINLKDVTQLQKYLAGWNVEIAAEYCDVNADGKINLKDVTHLQKFLAGWEVELGQP